ncbi:copper transporter [Luteipulveratus sp. YIM 133132]|uniref:Copper transporter n=1 Tax=Luteipulveratus flavus TaxID=3031728 RepID=A0ABT6C5K0_9MICO|nr:MULTISPECIES: copper transporter [unclassified Luteipulveratus]MDE9366088.1 copper transporter [Luteipulveratus sp. YIM 133132]MDF8264194.1 copper transporter [Luteipulveratus sp. YIM 133296]
MIDFRYHVVSLVSVFLALAVGIVIGATSLRDELAGGITKEVQGQRRDLAATREEVKEANRVIGLQDQYAEDVAPRVLPGQLTGRSVALLVLPGTEDSLVDSSRESLKAGGAQVTSTVRLDESWASGANADRDALLTTSAKDLGLDAATIPKNRLAGKVLVEAVAHQGSTGRADQAANGVLAALKDKDLASAQPAAPAQAASVVVLWPGMTSKDSDTGTVKAWTDIITAVGLAGRPVVGVASGPVKDDLTTPDMLVRALRRSPEVTGAMSTVDDGDRAVGQAALVLALREEFAGQSGQFGLDSTASTVTPSLTEGE